MQSILDDFQIFIGHRDYDFLLQVKKLLPKNCKIAISSNAEEIVNDLLELQPDLSILDYYIPQHKKYHYKFKIIPVNGEKITNILNI